MAHERKDKFQAAMSNNFLSLVTVQDIDVTCCLSALYSSEILSCSFVFRCQPYLQLDLNIRFTQSSRNVFLGFIRFPLLKS